MDDLFIPAEARPSVTLPLAQEAWALATTLEPPLISRHSEMKPDCSEGCLLVLARPEDQMASGFVAYAQALGICCARPAHLPDIDLSITAERNRETRVEIAVGPEHLPVQGILNRGWPFSPADSFQMAESYATWWSALACFSGPVINRSSRFGLVPDVDLLLMVKNVPNIEPPRIFIGNQERPPFLEPELNIHEPDGRYLGRMNKETEPQLKKDEIYVFTGFDPGQIKYLLLAADSVFDLSHEHGCLPSLLQEQISGVVRFLRTQNITFGLLVLQTAPSHLRVIRVNPFPILAQYKHIEQKVYAALLQYLVPFHQTKERRREGDFMPGFCC